MEASPNSLIPDRCYEILDFGSIDRQISRLCRVLGMMGEDGPAPLYDEEEEEALKKDEVRAGPRSGSTMGGITRRAFMPPLTGVQV